jgi:LmbE family N-acetylglucosaminyl deacetylase
LTPTPAITILAPHPDDEIFGVGGMMRELASRGCSLRVVAVTDGEGAFGRSNRLAREALVSRRLRERAGAFDLLGVAARVELIRLGYPDGDVRSREDQLTEDFVRLCAGSRSTVLAPWQLDGHPDHDATGRAARAAAAGGRFEVREYAVWAGHDWRRAVDTGRLRPVQLSAVTTAAKMRAVRAFRSQLEPSPDGRPVVPAELVERLASGTELLVA